MTLIGLLLIPLLVGGIAFFVFHATITWKEFLLQIGACVLIALAGWGIAKWTNLSSTEYLHGRITGKIEGTRKCCHCYDVCTRRDKNGNCKSKHEICPHSRDYYWHLNSSFGQIDIASCDDSDPPEEWKNAIIGEPASITNSYTNYLRADENSLLVHSAEHNKYLEQVPNFPDIYDIYKRKPIVSFDGVSIPENWQNDLRELNADLGPKKQIDITIVLTKIQNPVYAQAVEVKWLYGPKNSLNIVMGIAPDKTVKWARIVTISKVESVKVKLRDNLQGKQLGDPEVPKIIKTIIQSDFKRTPMANFEYLAKSVEPNTGWLIFLYIFNLIVACGICYTMHIHDIFG